MKWQVFFVFVFSSVTSLNAFKILAVFGLPGKSNSLLGHALVKLLSEAGHEITYITPRPPDKGEINANIVDVSDVLKYYNPDEYANLKDILINKPDVDKLIPLLSMVLDLSQLIVENPNVQELLADVNRNFDLVIAEFAFCELFAGFSAVYNSPYIWFSTVVPHWMILELVDEYPHPAYNADILSNSVSPFSFMERTKELSYQIWGHIAQLYLYNVKKSTYEKVFGKFIRQRGYDIPPWDEVKFNGSLVLSNSHVSFTMPQRLPSNFMTVGGFHIEDNLPPLPEDLKRLLDNSPKGVIYFSLGSNFKSKHMPETMKRELLNTFGKLKQTVIWKFEEELPDRPPNVHILNWAPQNNILDLDNMVVAKSAITVPIIVKVNGLIASGQEAKSQEPRPTLQEALVGQLGQGSDAESSVNSHGTHCEDIPVSVNLTTGSLYSDPATAHRNCILLITHGGLLTMTETVHFGVPVIAIPVRGDQHLNVNMAVAKGYAVKVPFTLDLAEDLEEALNVILHEPRYASKAKEVSAIYHDRPITPSKELVHWVEHVAKTKGAAHLRSPAVTLQWYQKYYFDLAFIIIGLIFLFKYLISNVLNRFVNIKNNNKKQK